MKRWILFIYILFISNPTLAEGVSCTQLLTGSNNPPVKTEYQIDFKDSKALKILRQVNRVFIEYPREYMENTKTQAKITVPESRWDEVFGQGYETVIDELAKVQIQRVDTFEDGTIATEFDRNLLVSNSNAEIKDFPNEWVTTQRALSFQFDRRVLTLMETHLEPAHVAIILEGGVIARSPEPYLL
jgi:hypothetical protein